MPARPIHRHISASRGVTTQGKHFLRISEIFMIAVEALLQAAHVPCSQRACIIPARWKNGRESRDLSTARAWGIQVKNSAQAGCM